MEKICYLIFIIIFLLLIILFYINQQLDQSFYDPVLFPELKKIKIYEDEIIKEFQNFMQKQNNWIPWPEKNLYDYKRDNWKVFPFFAFGSWSEKNCNIMPNLAKYLKSIPNLKVALLSKLGPNSKLEPHKGWGDYSNYIIRCHYGLKIPPNNTCFMAVKNNDHSEYEKQFHKYKEWLIFDDSKEHYASNESNKENEERIILIIDLERPKFIKKGSSNIKYSEELANLIKEFKKSLD